MKIVIIGGVAGGAGSAARLRRNDEQAEIIMFEKGEFISFANCGLPYYIGDVITDKNALTIQTPQSFNKRFNVDVRIKNEVLEVDINKKQVKVNNLSNNKIYYESYDKLIISPGAKPIVPNIKGVSDCTNVFTLRDIPDTFKIKNYIAKNNVKKATVIGGGYIGIEMAENLIHLGLEVTIVEASNHIIGSIDEDMSYDLQNHIKSKGVHLYLNNSVIEIFEDGVLLSDNSKIDSEMIIMSIGVSPATQFLKNSGIDLGKRNEILVNEFLETNIKDVYALGDAISVKSFVSQQQTIIPLASPANKQARIVADNVCGKKQKYKGTQGTAIAKIFDMTVAVTGESEKTLNANNIKYKKSLTYSFSNATYYPGAQPMFIKLLFDFEGKLLGSQITGFKGVDKRIDVLATAIRANMNVFDLQELELAYAPPYSSAKDPVNMAGYVASNIIENKTNPIFLEQLSEHTDAFILDVRTVTEFEAGSIENAINIPVDDLRKNISKLPKNKEIIVTCQIGLRGYVAEQILLQNGFNALNLIGGYRHYSQMVTSKNPN